MLKNIIVSINCGMDKERGERDIHIERDRERERERKGEIYREIYLKKRDR